MGHAEVLGVHPTATRSEIKAAFREAAKAVHPDINHSPEANEAFARIKAAHDALIAQAGNETEQASVKSAAASSARATAQAAYQTTPPPPPVTVAADTILQQTSEEVAAERELDRLASKNQVSSIVKTSRQPSKNTAKSYALPRGASKGSTKACYLRIRKSMNESPRGMVYNRIHEDSLFHRASRTTH